MERPFINYAHRGASHYMPGNSLTAFALGLYMGANGIETDVRKTKDGVLVLFHDNTLEDAFGVQGTVEEHTCEELLQYRYKKGSYTDRIMTLEDFCRHFGWRELTFAIELKGPGVEADTAAMLTRYGMTEKCVVTSFQMEYIRTFKALAPAFRVGLLTNTVTEELLQELEAIGAAEVCPRATIMTPELTKAWHDRGFGVRAWGVADTELMRHACRCRADGMTVNFPDKLAAYMETEEFKNR